MYGMVVRGTTRVTRKGQITIPAAIRAALRLSEGDVVHVAFDESTGKVTLGTGDSFVERTAGIFKPRLPVSSDIHELVASEKRLAEETARLEAEDKDRRSLGN